MYLSFGILHIPVLIHEGITPPLPNRGLRKLKFVVYENLKFAYGKESQKLFSVCVSDPQLLRIPDPFKVRFCKL